VYASGMVESLAVEEDSEVRRGLSWDESERWDEWRRIWSTTEAERVGLCKTLNKAWRSNFSTPHRHSLHQLH
jgi:hypothetical protein